PIHSSQRQSILRFLHESPTARTINDILQATSYDYEAGRKMIIRMRMAGELVSPARGLYTTSGHPCLASFPDPSSTSQPNPTPSPVPIVPSSDHSTDIPSLELSPASTVPTSLSTSAIPPTAAFATSSNHVPIVPHPPFLLLSPVVEYAPGTWGHAEINQLVEGRGGRYNPQPAADP